MTLISLTGALEAKVTERVYIVRELIIEVTTAYREMMLMNHEDFKERLKAIEPKGDGRSQSDSCSWKVDTNYTIPHNGRNVPITKFPALYFVSGYSLHCAWSLCDASLNGLE